MKLECTDTIDSTSRELRRRAERGELVGPVLLVAGEQTGGVGQFGRAWSSPRGGLWMTVALPTPFEPGTEAYADWVGGLGGHLGRLCCAAVAGEMRRLGWPGEVELKAPNDLLINSAKVCGLLTEIVADAHGRSWVLVGVGVNSNVDRAALPTGLAYAATSLKIELGSDVDQDTLTRALTEAVTRACAG